MNNWKDILSTKMRKAMDRAEWRWKIMRLISDMLNSEDWMDSCAYKSGVWEHSFPGLEIWSSKLSVNEWYLPHRNGWDHWKNDYRYRRQRLKNSRRRTQMEIDGTIRKTGGKHRVWCIRSRTGAIVVDLAQNKHIKPFV